MTVSPSQIIVSNFQQQLCQQLSPRSRMGIFWVSGTCPSPIPPLEAGGRERPSSSVGIAAQSLSHVRVFVTPWTSACQASLSFTISWSLLKCMSIESVMPSICRPLLLLPSIFPSIKVFFNESALRITWPKYWSFSFSISPPSEYSGLISFRMDWLDLLAVQGTLKSLQHHSLKASILRSAFFIVQLSYPYMMTRKSIALTAAAAKSLQLCPTLCNP